MYLIPCPSRDIYKENLVTAWFAFFFFFHLQLVFAEKPLSQPKQFQELS